MATLQTRNTVKAFARHKEDCVFRNEGDKQCKCPKYLLIYEADQKRNKMLSAHTLDWTAADNQAKEKLASYDPEKIELKQLRSKKELGQISLIDAVSLYLVDKESRLGKNGTVELAKSFWGDIDPETKELRREGRFFEWLATLPTDSRPVYVRDITTQHLTQWRASWKWNDLTRSTRWTLVKAFFGFCEAQGWLEANTARKLGPLKVARGNRTSIFTDKQYADILDAVWIYEPEFRPETTRKHWQERLHTFILLLRWSGMDLIDAVEFRPESITDGVLRYRRVKTGVVATIELPQHVLAALASVPLEPGAIAGQPFKIQGTVQDSNMQRWAHRLRRVFKLAKITEVRTDFRVRAPHAKQFRDTFAVWLLRHHVPVHSVSKALGHSSVVTTERAYLPWVKELENSHIEAMHKVMDAAKPKVSRTVTVIRRKA